MAHPSTFNCKHGCFQSNECKKGGYCRHVLSNEEKQRLPCFEKGKVAMHYFADTGIGGGAPLHAIDQAMVDNILLAMRNGSPIQLHTYPVYECMEAARRFEHGGYLWSEYRETLEAI